MMPRKSPSAADLTGFLGTISTIRSMALFSGAAAAAVAPVAGVAAGAALGGALLLQPRPDLRRDSLAGPQHIDQGDPDEDGDGRHHDRVEQGLEADPAQGPGVAHPGDAHHQRREDQRDHQHEQQAQEDLPERQRDVLDERREPWIVAHQEMGENSPGDAEEAADQDLGVEWQFFPGHEAGEC